MFLLNNNNKKSSLKLFTVNLRDLYNVKLHKLVIFENARICFIFKRKMENLKHSDFLKLF